MLFTHHSPAECQLLLPKLSKAIADGLALEKLKPDYPDFSSEDFAELFSIAKARHHADKLPAALRSKLLYTEEDLRFCTNWLVAEYRAKRLACDAIIEVGCGIGIQTIAFAKVCKQVYAIELDARKIRYAQENAKSAGCSNVEFLNGDALELLAKIPKADTLFCEPERDPQAAERRFGDLRPSITKLLKAVAHLTENCCIELPPQLKSVPLEGEQEYVSVDGKLNRQHLYTGKLAKCAVSAVALPSGARLTCDVGEKLRMPKSVPPTKFLYQLDATVIQAGLQALLIGRGLSPVSAEFLTAVTQQSSPFFAKSYSMLARVPFDQGRILAELQRLRAGKAIIRYPIPPDEYWHERKGYERHLRGTRILHIFQFGTNAYIGEER